MYAPMVCKYTECSNSAEKGVNTGAKGHLLSKICLKPVPVAKGTWFSIVSTSKSSTESYALLLKVCKNPRVKRRGCANIVCGLPKQCSEAVRAVLAVCLTLCAAWVRGVNSKDGASLQAD